MKPEFSTKVRCFHDGDCPICKAEVKAMKRLDRDGAIEWVDIVCDPAALDSAGIGYKQAMDRLHVIDENRQLQTGARAFLVLWKRLPYYRRLAVLVETFPGLLPLMECVYRIFAYYRLPLTGKRRISEKT
ncbi:DUF393 domain-containing protein [Methylomarinum sp. Ch1-1]|uniref:DUF393 domain-containing protein n=1 Tax=Methylomarinum roseum TaxID=3067653 RepID=A0AAU7NZX3_9GAMM|nr:DUF393 domain-containing protein [Methylomarinum sp. Ch1-1]MDP4521902.1 DUF393 domain-containing protein [Methylomarinum sp. Ch1-1]MDP4521929.1 DUF393 domain-containing protein [Methylomarinum sp. Ch1-1]